MTEAKTCSIYIPGEFMGNINKIEARTATFEVKPYAQYKEAVEITWVPKKARSKRYIYTKGFEPYALILAGYNHFDPPSLFGPGRKSKTGCLVSTTTYSCFDPRWKRDFSEAFYNYANQTQNLKILFMIGIDPIPLQPAFEAGRIVQANIMELAGITGKR